LLGLWRADGPGVVDGLQADPRTSVNKLIDEGLPPRYPAALSVLAFVPSDAQLVLIKSIVPSIPISILSKARTALLWTSIQVQTNPYIYIVLPPIRSYMTHHHKLTPKLWGDVFVCQLTGATQLRAWIIWASQNDCYGGSEPGNLSSARLTMLRCRLQP
jgi:hypothetical protein